MDAIVREHLVVNTLAGFLNMELTVVAVFVLSLEIINPVGYVAGLLYLYYKATCSDRVNAPRRNEKDI